MRTFQRILLFVIFLCTIYTPNFITEKLPIKPPEVYVIENVQIAQIPLTLNYENLSSDDKRQVSCLAENMYHEAKNQGHYGMKAVALVTMNRVTSGMFPDDVCAVVLQKNKNICQFSWVCQNVILKKDSEEYSRALVLAVRVYINYEQLGDITQGALFFHADYVDPKWNYVKTVVIGNHIFYKRGNRNDDAKNKSANEGRQRKALLLLADGRD